MGTSEPSVGSGGCENLSYRSSSDGCKFKSSASGDEEGSRGGRNRPRDAAGQLTREGR